MNDLAARLWDIEQIKQLKARYFRFLDTKQWEAYRGLFTDDAQCWLGWGGQPHTGPWTPDEFVQGISAAHDRDRAVSVHQGHMPEIEITGERTARGIWAMFDWVDHPQARAFQGFGHYYEEYTKGDDGRWRINVIRLTRLRTDQMPSTSEPSDRYGSVPEFWPPNPVT
jgi:hypothetical protein